MLKTKNSSFIKIVFSILILWPILFLSLQFYLWHSDKTFLIFCDVGQGDAILFVRKDFQMLVDTGPNNDQVQSCLNHYLPFFDRELDILVLTHPDADHIGSAPQVVRNFSPRLILAPPIGKENFVFQELLEEINLKPQTIVENFPDQKHLEINNDISIVFYVNYSSDMAFDNPFTIKTDNQTLSAKKSSKIIASTEYNDLSIATFLNIEGKKVLLTGDLEKKGESVLINRGVLNKIDLLKVGHHGSKSSTQAQFLELLQPRHAIISVGRNNYGHPATEIIERLASHQVETFRTDLLGDIVYLFDHSLVWFSSGKNLNYFRIFFSKNKVFD